MTSTTIKFNDNFHAGGGPKVFSMHGSIYHHMGTLLPNNDAAQPVYAQLYINDPGAALDAYLAQNPVLNPVIMLDIQTMLNTSHPYMSLCTSRPTKL
jgi:hypothetical protein